nr:hypothetical protein [Tanacetum cinerariifolium]
MKGFIDFWICLKNGTRKTDRESTISDFKSNVSNLLVATSIAAKGLDVKDLELVINYDAPNHYEDYVHLVGRTGRAGMKGCAVRFLSSEDDERYAPDLVKALELSNQVVPDDLKALADSFMAKEDEVRKAAKKAQAREYGFEEDKSDDSEDDGVRKAEGAARAAALAAAMNLQHNLARIQSESLPDHYEAEFEINDFPQNARWKVTHKETLGLISEWTRAAITTRGQYVQPELKRVLQEITTQAASLPSSQPQPGRCYAV